MTTWQSKRCAKRRYTGYRAQPNDEQLRAKRERADAARMAAPSPIYPVERRAGEWRGRVT